MTLTTAIDGSVLLDILLDDPAYRAASLEAVRDARLAGPLIACPVVWAEVFAAGPGRDRLDEMLVAAGITFDPFDASCARKAGLSWPAYRKAGGKRQRLIPDFLVGAHAMVRGDRLLTRDRGFYRTYFRRLKVVEPVAR